VVVQEALKEKKIEPKENVAVLKRLMIAVEKLSGEVGHSLELLDILEENKADKLDLQVQHDSLMVKIIYMTVTRLLQHSILQV
jgi:hypothetical protein